MQLPWFPKPIYKTINRIGFLLLLLQVCFYFFGFSILLPVIIVAVLWSGITVLGVFNIISGFFITPVCHIKTNKPIIALTFDDGPCEQTEEILNLLKKYNAKASFFIKGQNASRFPKTMNRIVKEGHLLGNHTFSHSSFFPFFSRKKMTQELKNCDAVISNYTHAKPIFFRPPFGVSNPRIANIISNYGCKSVGWSIRSFDTYRQSEKVIKKVKTKLQKGSIILLHDYSKDIFLILEQILELCTKEKLNMVTISDLIKVQEDE